MLERESAALKTTTTTIPQTRHMSKNKQEKSTYCTIRGSRRGTRMCPTVPGLYVGEVLDWAGNLRERETICVRQVICEGSWFDGNFFVLSLT